jgi:ABC-2 type transport system permease protein
MSALLRLTLRRDRVMIPAWVLCLAGLVTLTAASYAGLYATEESRREAVRTLARTPATLALYGRIYADSVGGITAWRVGGLATAFAGLMCVLLVVRHTRAEEDAGRAELTGAGALGRAAPLHAALAVAWGAALALGVLVALGLIATGLPAAGSLAIGLGFAACGVSFGALAALTAQLAGSSRAASGLALALLGAAYLLRAIGDAGPHWLSWLSPLGWGQQMRPFGGDRWWAATPHVVLAAAATLAALRLARTRDLGAGVLAPRPGPARGDVRSPLALAWRLQRAPLAGWIAGCAVGGAAVGSVAKDVGNIIGDSPQVRQAIARLGGAHALSDAYLVASLQLFAFIAAAYGVQAVLRLRAEEASGRAEPVLATPASRAAWAVGHLAIAAAGTAALMAATGLFAGLAHALETGDAVQLPRVLGAALAQTPAAWVLAGAAATLIGAAPRAAVAAWALLAACLALGQLGVVLDLPRAALDLSPFTHLPRLPGGALTAAPLVLAAIAAALAAAGVAALNRRDLTN